ncbi:Uncharacterized protein BP5553_06510 [Venustampulla echinocandica]|uniref:Secreted protein n=1 Tax=Venustampulla echinocandica TaxID=2656787 RepID=A0A370TK53_9HELO|nr:Uncharacterized protein BP5553_06510 [Venustampulla echinocandica]RDL35898.1 Uncharacterized protein BP5553_06510 [Venustampulla echinocandica]
MLVKSGVLLALASAAIAAPALDTRADAPNPNEVTINGITTSGTGCPQGTVGKYLSDDRQTFTLIFDQYQVQIGPGTQPADARKFCQVNLQLHYPSGFQYSILSTVYRGYAALDAGVTGTQEATYYFSGQSAQVSTKSSFKGPFSNNYNIADNVPMASTVWSPCGADLPINIKSQISLASTKTTAKGLMTDDSIDGKITWVTGVSWRKCK